MLTNNGEGDGGGINPTLGATARGEYERRMVEIRRGFELSGDGLKAAAARAALVDELVMRFWNEEVKANPKLSVGIAVTAIGGFGRGHLFPYSDVDLMFCVEKSAEKLAKDAIRRVSQSLWDCGLQVSLTTRPPGECERLDVVNPEFALSLLDLRKIGGDDAVFVKLRDKSVAKLRAKDAKAIGVALAELTRERHSKYGDTLFHLEPNIKDCPGGLRDANVCHWLAGLSHRAVASPHPHRKSEMVGTQSMGEYQEAVAFLAAVRCFLHYRHERDDNTLDWQAQDAAAQRRIGLTGNSQDRVDAAYWMRVYFRQARVVERCLLREAGDVGLKVESHSGVRRMRVPERAGFRLRDGLLELKATSESGTDAAHEPELVLAAFAAIAETGARLSQASEERIANAIPVLSDRKSVV